MAAVYPQPGDALDVLLAAAIKARLEALEAWLLLEPAAGAVAVYAFATHQPAGVAALVRPPLLACNVISGDSRRWAGVAGLDLFIPVPADQPDHEAEARLCHAVAVAVRDAFPLAQLHATTLVSAVEFKAFSLGEMTGSIPPLSEGGDWTTTTYAVYKAELVIHLSSIGI